MCKTLCARDWDYLVPENDSGQPTIPAILSDVGRLEVANQGEIKTYIYFVTSENDRLDQKFADSVTQTRTKAGRCRGGMPLVCVGSFRVNLEGFEMKGLRQKDGHVLDLKQ